MKTIVDNIVKAILADVTDRRGWRQEWDQFDEDIKEEIKETWRRIIQTELEISRP